MKFQMHLNWAPSVWAILYFVQIIFFALIYLLQSPSFYHATSHLEPSIWDDQRKMASEYVVQLENKREELRLADDLGEPRVEVFFRFDREKNQANVIVQDGGMGLRSFTGKVYLSRQQISAVNPNWRWLVRSDFFDEGKLDEKYGQGRPPWTGLSFEPSEEFVDLFQGWEAANRGQVSRQEGLVLRMIYFSVVTTTTLGYGDIVPLTAWARICVSIQSILGVVIIGGFLHSLLTRRTS